MIQTSNPRHRTGIDDLLDVAARRQTVPICVAADDATRLKYADSPLLEVWEPVLLHSGVDPSYMGYDRLHLLRRAPVPIFPRLFGAHAPTTKELLWRNLVRARTALSSGELAPAPLPENSLVRRKSERSPTDDYDFSTCVLVSDFHAWSVRVGLPVIGPWPTRIDAIKRAGGSVFRQYPRETSLLRVQEEVAWWCDKRASDLGHWPGKAAVPDMVREFGMSKNLATAFVTILRPDHLPRGRPRGSNSPPKRQR